MTVGGLGELYVYDTALRIGAKLNLLPNKVYLHAGTRSGAEALGFDGKATVLNVSDLPRELQKLEPHEIEDVLCIFKADLKKVDIKILEKDLLDDINKLGVGPLGLGGSTTALGVNILGFPTHIAGLPVAINISCHATRSAQARL